MALSLTYDTAQRRLKRDRIGLTVVGVDMFDTGDGNIILDLATNSHLLLPAPYSPAWETGRSGANARLGPGDFSFQDASKWFPAAQDTQGVVQIVSKVNGPGWALSSATYPKNRPFWIKVFNATAGADYELLRGGWNSSASLGGGVGFVLYSSGAFEIWKDGVLRHVGKVTGGGQTSQAGQQWIGLSLFPCLGRSLVVWSTQGDSFEYVFEEIDANAADPTITPAGKFWFSVVSAKAQVEVAPMAFATSGYTQSVECSLAEAPETGATFDTYVNPSWAGGTTSYQLYGKPPGYGTSSASASLRKLDGSSFTANGTDKSCRFRTTLTGDGTCTPFVQGATISYAPTFATTDATESQAVTSYLQAATLSVPVNPSDVELSVTLKDHNAIQGIIPQFYGQFFRPVLAKVGASQILVDGLAAAPRIEYRAVYESEKAEVKIRDRWQILQEYIARDSFPITGQFNDVLTFFLTTPGAFQASELDLEALSFGFDATLPTKDGQFALAVAEGDRFSDWVTRLFDDYASTWFYGIVPTASGVKFQSKSRATLASQAVVYHLWLTLDDAITGLQAAPYSLSLADAKAAAWKYVYRNFDTQPLAPEANEVRVTGVEPSTGRALQAFKVDNAAKDPTTKPSLRPENWAGMPLRYGVADERLINQTLVNRATDLQYDLITPVRKPVQFSAEFMLRADGAPVWRGQKVRLHGNGSTPTRDVTITSISTQFMKEPNGSDTWQWREATYTGEVV